MTANIPNPVSTESSRTSANFQIKSAKVYVPVITISINNNIKFLENLKEGFERPISWNEYKTKKTTQPKNNSFNYIIDSTFNNINILFALSFKAGEINPTRNAFGR